MKNLVFIVVVAVIIFFAGRASACELVTVCTDECRIITICGGW